MDAARARGRGGGRRPSLTPTQIRRAGELYRQQELPVQEIADLFGVSRMTIYRHLQPAPTSTPATPARPTATDLPGPATFPAATPRLTTGRTHPASSATSPRPALSPQICPPHRPSSTAKRSTARAPRRWAQPMSPRPRPTTRRRAPRRAARAMPTRSRRWSTSRPQPPHRLLPPLCRWPPTSAKSSPRYPAKASPRRRLSRASA
ncbi:helix-turn-helix domain-containing protein [Nonomuraea lactucae]|uniref:helix-turn-helix domain-containing protein n=1 Tax=Nonomuraea lactucae TaxID=2249762 RepID=UPI003B82EA2C